ncbi:MAG: DUF3750 domain-containing protein [Pseudomonadota bacterium]
MRFFLRLLTFLFFVFIVPALLHAGVWAFADRPTSWHQANWSSAGVLPAPRVQDASIYVMAARTGGMKGAFATHSWIVIKKPGQARYDRYDVVGWGRPLRKNAYDADGRWYSNPPEIHHALHGAEAARLVPQVEAAIAQYRWQNRGDYTLWPGPNSNSFVGGILRAVPDLNTAAPSTAVGRDYPTDGRWFSIAEGTVRATLGGYIGLVAGAGEGLELNFLGLVAGINPMRGEIKIPAFGTYRLWKAT